MGEILSNAALVGAKRVMGPGWERSSTRPAALMRETKVVNSGLKTIRSSTEQSGVQAPRGAALTRLGGWSRGGWSWWGTRRWS